MIRTVLATVVAVVGLSAHAETNLKSFTIYCAEGATDSVIYVDDGKFTISSKAIPDKIIAASGDLLQASEDLTSVVGYRDGVYYIMGIDHDEKVIDLQLGYRNGEPESDRKRAKLACDPFYVSVDI